MQQGHQPPLEKQPELDLQLQRAPPPEKQPLPPQSPQEKPLGPDEIDLSLELAY